MECCGRRWRVGRHSRTPKVSFVSPGALDRIVLVDVLQDGLGLFFAIPKFLKPQTNRLIDDFEHSTASKLRALDQSDVWLDAVVSQSVMKLMVPVGSSTVAWALRNHFSPISRTSSHNLVAASFNSAGP